MVFVLINEKFYLFLNWNWSDPQIYCSHWTCWKLKVWATRTPLKSADLFIQQLRFDLCFYDVMIEVYNSSDGVVLLVFHSRQGRRGSHAKWFVGPYSIYGFWLPSNVSSNFSLRSVKWYVGTLFNVIVLPTLLVLIILAVFSISNCRWGIINQCCNPRYKLKLFLL
jgi:hypothetical protein